MNLYSCFLIFQDLLETLEDMVGKFMKEDMADKFMKEGMVGKFFKEPMPKDMDMVKVLLEAMVAVPGKKGMVGWSTWDMVNPLEVVLELLQPTDNSNRSL
jgi:hypothetical protein